MNKALMKGSFDPITREHISAIIGLIKENSLDKLYISPEKDSEHSIFFASYEKRCEMVREALSEVSENIEVGDFDENDGVILILSEEPYIMSSARARICLEKTGFCDEISPEVNDIIETSFIYGTDAVSEKRCTIIKYLLEKLPFGRIKHILSVEREAFRLGKLLSLTEREIYDMRIAALCHDITRYNTVEENVEIAGKEIKKSDLDFPEILHGISGAELAKKLFGISKRSYDAIRYHTTGKRKMGIYEKILWLADYIEEERKHISCIEVRKRFEERLKKDSPVKAFDFTMLDAMQGSVNYLKESGKAIHPFSIFALEDMKKEVKKYGST